MLDNESRRPYGTPPDPSSQPERSPMDYDLDRSYSWFDVRMDETNGVAPIGFLTVVEPREIGFCGGLLLLNQRGRPLEFHCNAPIRPNRTQEILYGTTLRAFVLAESIAASLIEKCSRPPAAILTDLPELWELSQSFASPLFWVPKSDAIERDNDPLPLTDRWTILEIAGQSIGVPISAKIGQAEVDISVRTFAQYLPLSEPFQRIHQAIEEAHRTTGWRESA